PAQQRHACLLPPVESPAPASSPAARAPEGGCSPLTLADLENLALAGNPTIPQAAALVQQQQGLLKQAGLYPNPTAGYLRTDPDQPGQSQTVGVFLSQEIVTARKLLLAKGAGRREVERSEWQLQAQRT